MHPLHPAGLACASTLALPPPVRQTRRTPAPPKPGPRPRLTAQQATVARLAAEGRRDEDIGAVLGITTKTAKNHLQAVYRRLGVTSRVSLAAALGAEVRPTLAELTAAATERGGLNASQAEVLWHLLRGETNKVIARALKVSPPTVKLRLRSAYRATGATCRAELAAAVRAWF